MKIPLKFALALQSLIDGKELNEGDFGGRASKDLLQPFLETGAIDYRPVGTQRKKYFCQHKKKIEDHLHHHFQIPSLEVYIQFLKKEEAKRSEAVFAASDSKLGGGRIMEGFLIHTYSDEYGMLNGHRISLRPAEGSYLFIHDFRNFAVPPEVTVVGVENYDNFRFISKQRELFKTIKPVFIWRYQNSNSISEWMKTSVNTYLHFGDFDPEGLKIYVTQFRNKIGQERCCFLIPDNIESLLFTHGNKELFERQTMAIRKSDFDGCPELAPIVGMIWRLKKGLEQEVLIRLN